ncbi:hypothetical protein [Rhodoplanes roseus]|uniref:Uncharacterized protein n=1 Tax=Rhodoplanes roseus TaxID=29409 RepID=A0A327L5G6_9BRAD|nr:hypothetical protein [Rhodoplanes roseus]RAI44802.1 hypothetical protein CH341_07185 [Rhodoplanes roseus]
MIIEITGQEGRRFWGVSKLSSGAESTNEPFIGAFAGRDGKKLVMADTDGYFTAELVDADTLSFCYAHAGGKTASSVVSCNEVKRAR